MMSYVNAIIDAINQCPEYIGKGIMQLLILTLGGVIVAWITTLVFGRKSEINAVEGTLLKRKMDIYEELCGKLETLKSAVAIPEKISESAIKLLQEEGLEFIFDIECACAQCGAGIVCFPLSKNRNPLNRQSMPHLWQRQS